MSYQSISVKEAVTSISSPVNGWFLPPVQRPYVWGSRHESEKYICKLFDSILRGYPIGSIIVWVCEKKTPYKEFITDYKTGDSVSSVDSGLWTRKDKWLVYDGQQRLQTLYSCLKYTLNEKVLVFNLLFDLSKSDDDDVDKTGFYFVEKNTNIEPASIRMNEIFVKTETEKTVFRKTLLDECQTLNITEEQETLIEQNLDKLWDVFVKTDVKSIAYFPIQTTNEDTVNEIFKRLNTGGVPLSKVTYCFHGLKQQKLEKTMISKKLYKVSQKEFLTPQIKAIYLTHTRCCS